MSTWFSLPVPPINVNMTQSPVDEVTEGEQVTFICETGSSNPDANVKWTLDGTELKNNTEEAEEGDWGANRIVSEMTLVTSRHMNKAPIVCNVLYGENGKGGLSATGNVGVKCESCN